MARATAVNALSEQTLASSVSIGGTSLTLSADPGAYMPSGSGVFGLIITEGTIADTEIVEVTRSGTTCTLTGATTFAKAHNAGATVKYVMTELDFADFLRVSYLDTDGTLAANSDSKIASQKAIKSYVDTKDAANVKLTGAQTVANVKTFSSPVRSTHGGSTTQASYAMMSSSIDGIGHSSGSMYLYANGVWQMRWATSGITPLSSVLFNNVSQEYYAAKSLSSSFTYLSAADAPQIMLSATGAGKTLLLPALSARWYFENTGSYDITIDGDGDEGMSIVGGSFTLAVGDFVEVLGNASLGTYRKVAWS